MEYNTSMAEPPRSNPSPLSPQTIRHARNFLRRTTEDRRQAQDRSSGLTDAYEEMMGGVGGIKRSTGEPPRKSYTTAKDGETEREMGRQRAMVERAEQFVSPEAATGEEGETPPRSSSTAQQTTETEGAQERTRGPEAQQMAQSQALMFAQAEEERQQTVRRGALLGQAMQRQQSLETARKKQAKITRSLFRRFTSVLIPVIGIMVALNIEFIHDRVKPLIPTLPQEHSASRELVTVAGDGGLCCCCFLQFAFPLLIAGAIFMSLT
ncbi:MAG: hypothetical protein Q8R07_01030 [Candidatus Uhrbacteria bacterium]|nr:hypothetical protein [Candidatus Uhrbacteria bacterium]